LNGDRAKPSLAFGLMVIINELWSQIREILNGESL